MNEDLSRNITAAAVERSPLIFITLMQVCNRKSRKPYFDFYVRNLLLSVFNRVQQTTTFVISVTGFEQYYYSCCNRVAMTVNWAVNSFTIKYKVAITVHFLKENKGMIFEFQVGLVYCELLLASNRELFVVAINETRKIVMKNFIIWY